MKLTWLHISDIHFHYSSYESSQIRDDLINKVSELTKTNKIDCVFLTGDLADKDGQYDKDLANYINNICSAAGIIKDNMFIIPGNHDHDRTTVSTILNDIYDYYDEKREGSSELEVNDKINSLSKLDNTTLLDSFNNYKKTCQDFYGVDELELNHSVKNNTQDKYSIICVNTAIYDRSSDDAKKELHIGVKQLNNVIKNSLNSDSKINIAIGHHPTTVMAPEEKKRFLGCLKSNNIHLYLCGHKHIPDFVVHNQYDVTEIICGYGNMASYAGAVFSVGTIDTLKCEYYIDFYKWKDDNSWVRDTSPNNCDEFGRCYIKGKHFNHKDIINAVIPIKTYTSQITTQEIEEVFEGKDFEIIPFPFHHIDTLNTNWKSECNWMDEIANSINNTTNKRINIFPIAPIPLLVYLGYQLQKNKPITIYQYDRHLSKWVDSSNSPCPDYSIDSKKKLFRKKKLLITIQTSTEIQSFQIPKDVNGDIINLSMTIKNLGMPLYSNHYHLMLQDLFARLNPIIGRYSEIHLLASVPAGMAIEIGRNIQKSVFPNVILYNYYKGNYIKTITLE